MQININNEFGSVVEMAGLNVKITNIVEVIDIIARSETTCYTRNLEPLLMRLEEVCDKYKQNNLEAEWIVNKGLARCYEYEFNLALASRSSIIGNTGFLIIKSLLEKAFYEKAISDYLDESSISDMPEKPDKYLDWLRSLMRNHKSFSHKFYTNFLNRKAEIDDLRYYLAQESTLDPRFDDLLALIQIGMPSKMKLELASNYWDEMGCGNIQEIHNRMFNDVLLSFEVTDEYIKNNILLSSLVCGNISSYLALYRQTCYQAIGYFGVTEYCVPNRFVHFIAACERIGLSHNIAYHKLHVTIDAKHAHGWFVNAIVPAVEENRLFAKRIAEGALLRLNSSLRYLDEIYSVLEKCKC